jgi:hypothetical protein
LRLERRFKRSLEQLLLFRVEWNQDSDSTWNRQFPGYEISQEFLLCVPSCN